jgi:hypothetical protein
MAENRSGIDGSASRPRNVAPTIVIGLGGTGKEVLLRLRRRFYERYGLFGFPTIGYLWIDTDTRNRNIDDQPLDHIMEQVMFREEERVSAEVPGEAFIGYFDDQRVSPHIFRWLDPKLAALGQVLNGAGQVRPLGRLAFFHTYSDIRTKLDKLLAQVQAQNAVEQMRDKHKIIVDGSLLDVMIVFSIAGGTGSGMFLDTAFMCREALPKPNITGYLMLPSVFSDAIKGSEKIFANAYAALKELEYYSYRKDLAALGKTNGKDELWGENSRHDFVADWENKERNAGIKPRPIKPPPFDTCYLIDNVTHGGGSIGPKHKSFLCDMIAENMFLNFSSEEFSRAKDSVRSNLEQYLGNPLFYRYDEHGREGGYTEILSQRFSSLGFSKLYVPIDRIRRACGYQLGLDLIGRWLERKDLSEIEIEKQIEDRELGELRLRAGGGADDFMKELRAVGEGTFDEEVSEEVNRWREELLQRVNTEKSPDLYSLIPNLLKDFVRRNLDRSDVRKEKWGTYIKTLDTNRERLIRQLCGEFDISGKRKPDAAGQILLQVKEWLKSDHVRIYLAIEYLKMLGKILDRHVEEYYVKIKEAADRKATASLEDIKIKLEMVRDEESGRLVWRKSLRVLVEQLCDRIREHLTARITSLVAAAAIETIKNHVKPYIGKEEIKEDARGQQIAEHYGLILELWSLRDELTNVHAQLKDRFDSFERVEEHLIYENLYEKGMFRDYYQIQRPEGFYPVKLKLDELESWLFQRLQIANPHDLRQLIKERGRERVLTDIEEFCYGQFHELEVNVDALEIFARIYQDAAERSRRVDRLVKNGLVRLQKSKQATTYTQLERNRKESALISFNTKNRTRFREIYEEIESQVRAAGYRDITRPTSERADSVFLYTEYAGIPLAYIRNIDRYYEEAYLPHLRQGSQLHIDYRDEKFTDIMIKNTEEIGRTLRANRALLVGTILRAINFNSDGNGDVSFSFTSYRDGMAATQPLGMQPVAVETLKRNSQMLEAVEGEINKRRAKLTPEARLKFYTLLAYHIMDNENPDGFPAGPFARSYQMTAEGMTRYYSPECKAIEETQSQEYRQLVQVLGSEDSVREGYRRLYQTKDNFSQEILINNRRMRVLKPGSDS